MQTMKTKLNHTPYNNNSSHYATGSFSGSLETDSSSFFIIIHDLRNIQYNSSLFMRVFQTTRSILTNSYLPKYNMVWKETCISSFVRQS